MSVFRSTSVFFSFCCLLTAQTPSFKPSVSFATRPGPLASVTADFNGDGHVDLAIANTADQSVSILLGVGDGTFQPAVTYPAGCQIGQVITGDFNRDGHMDLLGSCTLTDTIVVLPGAGNGTFGAAIKSEAPLPVVSGFLDNFVQPLTTADINGDGILDLAIIMQTSQLLGLGSPGAIGQTVTMLGNGDGTFTYTSTLNIAPPGTETYAVQLADMNGDGKQDIVGIAFNYNAGGLIDPLTAFVIVALGDGKGGFALANSYPLTTIPQTGMLLGDVNGDGKTDVVFAGLSISAVESESTNDLSGVGVFLGNGDGSLTPGYTTEDSQVLTNQATVGSVLAPVMGSGYPDIVSVVEYSALATNDLSGGVIVRPNNGDGTFGAAQTIVAPSPALAFSLSAGDFNGDGKPDLAVFNFSVNLLELILTTNIETQIDEIGQALATLPSATASILLNETPSTKFTDTNAASFAAGPVAASSIVSAFGSGLASSTASATTLPLPLTLGGASIAVTDALNVTRSAPLFYASPTQVNYAIPDGTAVGAATVAITTPSGVQKVSQTIASVAPGVFGASGIAAAQVFTYTNSATPAVSSTIAVSAQGVLSAAPINVTTGSVYLILYGTGIRNHQSAVTATVGTATLPTAFAGAQGGFVGEDQVNVLLPATLKGAGLVNVTLSVDGKTTNAVKIAIE